MTHTITITLEGDNMMDITQQANALKTVAMLPLEDRRRLLEIAGSKKALSALKSKWSMLKTMFK